MNSDDAQTEAAGDDMDWEGLDEDYLAELTGKGEEPEADKEGSEASRSKRSSQRQSSCLRTRHSDVSQLPSSTLASGYKMHAVSSRSGESAGPVKAGQDLEDIGAQSVLEF